MTVRRHATRSPYSYSGDIGVLYIGGGASQGEGEIPLLRAAVSCPKANSPGALGEGLSEYLDGLARETLEAAAEVEDAEAAYYEAGGDRDEAYRGQKGRGARLGQHFGPGYLRRSPVVALLICDFEVPPETLDRLTSKGPDPEGGAVAVAHRGGIRLAGPHRGGAAQTVILDREARGDGPGDSEGASSGLARRGREAEYLRMRGRLARPQGARVARLLLALRPTRVAPYVSSGERDVLEELAARAGVGRSGLLMARAMVAAGFAKRRAATSRKQGAIWMSAKMRVDTAAALSEASGWAMKADSAYAPGSLVCRPTEGVSRAGWLSDLRRRMPQAGTPQGTPKLAFSGAAAAAAFLSGSALEAPTPGKPLRMVVVGGEAALPDIAPVLSLEPLDVEEDEEELPKEVVMLTGYPDRGVLIDSRREAEGPLTLASPTQLLVDLLLYPADCEADYLEGLKSALRDSL